MAPLNPTIVVVDPDPAVRAGMDLLVRRAGWFPRLFATAAEFLGYRTPIGPSCLIVRVDLPELDGLELVRRTGIERPEMPVVAISNSLDIGMTVQAMKAGAVDYLVQPVADDRLVGAMAAALMRSRAVLEESSDLLALRERHAGLSYREREVMVQVVSGLLNKQVGAVLGISEITVKAHRGRVMRKMGAHSLAHLVGMALRLGAVSPGRPPFTPGQAAAQGQRFSLV
jgi:FixJ family two-component response regulator